MLRRCRSVGSLPGVDEEVLSGGNSSVVTRIGDAVHRQAGPWTPAVHALLAALRDAGIDGVPKPRGFDEQGREVLSFIPGDVANYPLPDWVWHPPVLDDAGSLLRRIHDAGVGLVDRPLVWNTPTHDPVEVICHNDVAPYNMAFEDGVLTGLFDFDAASPGPRIWDLAYLAYRLAPLVGDAEESGLTVDQRLLRIDRLVQAYGLPFKRFDVLVTVVARLDELAEFTDGRAADTGDAMFLEHSALYRRDRAEISRLVEQS